MKKYSKFWSLFFGTFLLVACGNGQEEGEIEGEAEEEIIVGEDIEGATDLEFWTFAGTHTDFFVNAAERWNEEYPDRPIQLNAQTYPFDQMHNNLLLAIQSGQGAPDIADIEIANFANFLQGDVQIEPLNDLIEPELDNFVQERLDIYAQDGNYYGAPTHLGATVVYYNMDYMEEAGVDIDSIETWDDYVEAGKEVVDTVGVPMTTIPISWYGYWPFIAQRGSDFFDDDGELIIDNEINIETLEFIQDLVYEHEIAEVSPGGNYHAEEFYGYMNDGGAASIIVPLFYMKDFLEYMPDLEGKMEIRPMPVFEEGDAQSVAMGGTGTVVTSQSDNVELAKDFLYFAKLSEEANIRLWTELGFDPPRWDVWDSPELQEDNEYYQYFDENIFEILLDIRDDVEGVNLTENTPDALEELGSSIMHNTIRENNMTPEEALREGADVIRSYMN
jgi:arabinosaccharide transport system substrate-binding protein